MIWGSIASAASFQVRYICDNLSMYNVYESLVSRKMSCLCYLLLSLAGAVMPLKPLLIRKMEWGVAYANHRRRRGLFGNYGALSHFSNRSGL